MNRGMRDWLALANDSTNRSHTDVNGQAMLATHSSNATAISQKTQSTVSDAARVQNKENIHTHTIVHAYIAQQVHIKEKQRAANS